MEQEKPCIVHMHMFGSIAYVMILDGRRGKLDERRIKCMFFKYMKAYKLICLEAKKIIESRNVVFMKDSGSIRVDLMMRPSGGNKGPMVMVVDELSKLPLFDGGR